MVFWFIVLDCAAIVLFMCYIVEFSQMALWKTVPDGVLEAIGDMKKQSRRAAGECNSQTGRFLRIPATWQELQLTAEQRMTEPGQQFLMYHSPTNDILIFAIDARVKLLAESIISLKRVCGCKVNCDCGPTTTIRRRPTCLLWRKVYMPIHHWLLHQWLMVLWFNVLDSAAAALFMCYIMEFNQVALWKTVPDGVEKNLVDIVLQNLAADFAHVFFLIMRKGVKSLNLQAVPENIKSWLES
ncbi:hypothetical protein T4D_13479 [Trichinella pseudospiralis]|uniref:Uncharacterized protein n=1 Tax=Trichinella pseudospiralis TaxID=6337 RepID=A0A0V1G5Q8_TRIPS|nr:hypothetical protein T4D_13479 [Trichinella pseudospiralis]